MEHFVHVLLTFRACSVPFAAKQRPHSVFCLPFCSPRLLCCAVCRIVLFHAVMCFLLCFTVICFVNCCFVSCGYLMCCVSCVILYSNVLCAVVLCSKCSVL